MMDGCGGGRGPCAGSKDPNIGTGCRNKCHYGDACAIPCNRLSNS